LTHKLQNQFHLVSDLDGFWIWITQKVWILQYHLHSHRTVFSAKASILIHIVRHFVNMVLLWKCTNCLTFETDTVAECFRRFHYSKGCVQQSHTFSIIVKRGSLTGNLFLSNLLNT
jgi:hypothetical protein